MSDCKRCLIARQMANVIYNVKQTGQWERAHPLLVQLQELWDSTPAAPASPATATNNHTIFECRLCDRTVWGFTDGRFVEAGWSRIDHIDGPNAICPYCQQDDLILEGLREDYPDAIVAAISPSDVNLDTHKEKP